MGLVSSLEKNCRQTINSSTDLHCEVLKNEDGVYMYKTSEGFIFSASRNLEDFMALMPQMSESKCANYGSDD